MTAGVKTQTLVPLDLRRSIDAAVNHLVSLYPAGIFDCGTHDAGARRLLNSLLELQLTSGFSQAVSETTQNPHLLNTR